MSLLLNKKSRNINFEKNLLNENKEIVERVKKLQSVIQNLSETTKESEKIINHISESFKKGNELFSELNKTTNNINNSMENAMEALQFQDIIRQQLEHIIYFLDNIFKSIESNIPYFEKLGIDFCQNDKTFLEETKLKLRKKAKTSDEKTVLQ